MNVDCMTREVSLELVVIGVPQGCQRPLQLQEFDRMDCRVSYDREPFHVVGINYTPLLTSTFMEIIGAFDMARTMVHQFGGVFR